MTEEQARRNFAAYFLDLQAQNAQEGAKVDKQTEWDFYIRTHIEEGDLPQEAAAWKCPRSLSGLVHKGPK